MLKYSCKTVLNSVISPVGEKHSFLLLVLRVAVEQWVFSFFGINHETFFFLFFLSFHL